MLCYSIDSLFDFFSLFLLPTAPPLLPKTKELRIARHHSKICVYYASTTKKTNGMRHFRISLIALLLFAAVQASAQEPIKYDSTYAKKLGADFRGMRQYVLVFLKRGTTTLTDTAKRNALQRAHLANIGKLAEQGKLIVAGPFMDNTELRGIYIFAVSSIEEAQQLTQTDPAVIAGTLVMELHPWYGTAALMEVPNIHKKLQKQPL